MKTYRIDYSIDAFTVLDAKNQKIARKKAWALLKLVSLNNKLVGDARGAKVSLIKELK